MIISDTIGCLDSGKLVFNLAIRQIDTQYLTHAELGQPYKLANRDHCVTRFKAAHSGLDEQRIEDEVVMSVEKNNLCVKLFCVFLKSERKVGACESAS
jgi:hypothetical protein